MTKKSLQSWYNDGEINYNQKEIIKKFGVGDYHPEHALWDLKKLWYFNEILIRNRYKLEAPFGNDPVHYMIFFSAKWNNNLILVVCGSEDNLKINLIVYEMPSQQMEEIFEVFCVDMTCRYVGWAKTRANEIKDKLRSEENPVLSIILKDLKIYYYDDYNNSLFPAFYGDLFGKKIAVIKLPFSVAKNSPDEYIKPLDIVKRFASYIRRGKKVYMVHACIYLGNRKICHARAGNNVDIESWDDFFSINIGNSDKLIRYHPVIAFKKSEKIIEHVAKCVEGKNNYYSIKSEFNVLDDGDQRANNCECFVNRCVLGLNFSELADIRNGKSSREINTRQKLEETNYDLDRLTSYPSYKIREIEGYTNVYHPQGIDMESYIEVQPKSSIFKDIIYNNI